VDEYQRNTISGTKYNRADRIADARQHNEVPESGELWMCQVCEDTLGVGDSVTKIWTCDRCFRNIEAERVWVASWYRS